MFIWFSWSKTLLSTGWSPSCAQTSCELYWLCHVQQNSQTASQSTNYSAVNGVRGPSISAASRSSRVTPHINHVYVSNDCCSENHKPSEYWLTRLPTSAIAQIPVWDGKHPGSILISHAGSGLKYTLFGSFKQHLAINKNVLWKGHSDLYFMTLLTLVCCVNTNLMHSRSAHLLALKENRCPIKKKKCKSTNDQNFTELLWRNEFFFQDWFKNRFQNKTTHKSARRVLFCGSLLKAAHWKAHQSMPLVREHTIYHWGT